MISPLTLLLLLLDPRRAPPRSAAHQPPTWVVRGHPSPTLVGCAPLVWEHRTLNALLFKFVVPACSPQLQPQPQAAVLGRAGEPHTCSLSPSPRIYLFLLVTGGGLHHFWCRTGASLALTCCLLGGLSHHPPHPPTPAHAHSISGRRCMKHPPHKTRPGPGAGLRSARGGSHRQAAVAAVAAR